MSSEIPHSDESSSLEFLLSTWSCAKCGILTWSKSSLLILKTSHICNTKLEGLTHLAAFGNEQIILLCIVIQSVKVLAAFFNPVNTLLLPRNAGHLFSLYLAVNPESFKGGKNQESSKIYNWTDPRKET